MEVNNYCLIIVRHFFDSSLPLTFLTVVYFSFSVVAYCFTCLLNNLFFFYIFLINLSLFPSIFCLSFTPSITDFSVKILIDRENIFT
jgi:hypothetical protein